MEDQSLKPIHCKVPNDKRAAAVCRASGEPLVVEEIVVDPPKAHEIRIKVTCTSLCYTDLTFWRAKGKGKTIVLGVEKEGKPLCLPSIEFLFGKCVMGSLFGGIKPKTDIPILAEKCMNKELELEKLITLEVGLEEINTAFNLLLQGKSLRCTIWMDK